MRGEGGGLLELSSNFGSLTLTSREGQHVTCDISFAHGSCLLVLNILPSPPVGAGYGICPRQTLCAFMVLSLVTPSLQTDCHLHHSSPPARPFSCTLVVTSHQLGPEPPAAPFSSPTLGESLYLYVSQCPRLGNGDDYTPAPNSCYKDWLK